MWGPASGAVRVRGTPYTDLEVTEIGRAIWPKALQTLFADMIHELPNGSWEDDSTVKGYAPNLSGNDDTH